MQRVLLRFVLLLFVFGFTASSQASTYLTFFVNQDSAHVMEQGDYFAWEFDVSTPGNEVSMELYLDIDNSQSLTKGDIWLAGWSMVDGSGESDGPEDLTEAGDGIIYAEVGRLGLAPGNYLMRVIDEDKSVIVNWFSTEALETPVATISGQVIIEGITAPNPAYSYILIGARREFGEGVFAGMTDENGNYSINLDQSGIEWQVELFFESPLPDHIAPQETFVFVNPGENGNVDLFFSRPNSFIYGQLMDESGEKLTSVEGEVWAQNIDNGSESVSSLLDGEFNIGVSVEADAAYNDFFIGVDSEDLMPDYLIPFNNNFFQISHGDSLVRDITVFSANASIHGYISIDGVGTGLMHQIDANSDSIGYTQSYSDPASGYFELRVHETGETSYWVNLATYGDYGIPEGYTVEYGSFREATPGDTIYYNLVQPPNLLKGLITFDPGDPTDIDFDELHVQAYDTFSSESYQATVKEDLSFELFVPSNNWMVEFDAMDEDYLSSPKRYENISVDGDTVESLNFELNYAHAEIRVRLVNSPVPASWLPYESYTTGKWPFVYHAYGEAVSDSQFILQVCEGDWVMDVPYYDDSHEVIISDSILTVSENDSLYEVVFTYQAVVGIASEEEIPASFYLDQNYPNPFNPVTTIRYGLATGGPVNISIFNMLGQKVNTLVDTYQPAGHHQINWQPENVSSGIYVYRIDSQGFTNSRKLLLVR